MPKSKSTKNFPLKKLMRFIEFSLFALFLSLFPAPNIYFTPVTGTVTATPQISITLPPPPPIPVNSTELEPPVLSAEGIIIKDLDSGVTIYSKNEKELLYPASTTKVMTAIVILENYNLDDVFTVKTVITEGRVMNLISGEKLTVESLLYGTLVHSANDAAYTLAENYPGGVEAFVAKMNHKAKELGLTNTYFVNPIGFDDPRHYTTARDLVKLATYALKNKTFDKIVSTKAITVSDINFTYFHNLTNVNQLLGKVAGVSGVKTGYTAEAGEILISTVKKNGHTVLFAVLKSNDRFAETERLIDWVFNNFNWVSVSQITPTE